MADTYSIIPAKNHSAKKLQGALSAASTIAMLLAAPLIAVFLIVFVFQSYQVDGPSMETTLKTNDRLIVWKLPRTWARLTQHNYIPNRGDVVVFNEPDNAIDYNRSQNKQLIKRVIGLPGDKVVVSDNTVTVYNQQPSEGFQPDATLPYGPVIKSTPLDGEWQLAQDEIFVMGDNRTNSLDSRTFGPIKASNIVGKLAIRILPLNNVKRF